jgi:predicted nucleic acid-binding Zn finger protein
MTQATTRRHVDRQALAQELAALGCVRQVGKSSWLVLSPKSGHVYLVDRRRDPWGTYDRWECSCPDHHFRGAICKHIRGVKAHLGIDDDPLSYFEREEDDPHVCRGCGCWLSDPKGLCSACATPKAEVPADPWQRLR